MPISKEYRDKYLSNPEYDFTFEDEFNLLDSPEIKTVVCSGYGNHYIFKDTNNISWLGFIISILNNNGVPSSYMVYWLKYTDIISLDKDQFLFDPPRQGGK